MYNAIIVDDEPRAVDALKENVDWKKCGIRKVYSAYNMVSAIKIIQESQVEILICDIEMPNGSGIQLLEWLTAHQIKMNCIFVTCHQEYNIMRKAIQLKCYDYILKPIDYDEFMELLHEMITKMENKTEVPGQGEDVVQWGESLEQEVLDKDRHVSRNPELEVKQYVREHMADNIMIADIAAYLHFSPQYLMRVFKNETGMSILEYIVYVRIEAAKKVLKGTRLPIKEVAYMVGYEDCVYFTKVFHKAVGTTPSQYRKMQQGRV